MADPQTSTVRLTKPTQGGDVGTWPGLLNSDWDYVDQALNQTVTINVADANFTITADGTVADQARYLRYNITGAWTAARTGTLPANAKVGWVTNSTTGGKNLILSAGGTSLTIPPDGNWYFFQCDGSNTTLPPVVFGNVGSHDIGRNLLHNSMFNVAQRGAGPFTTSGYTADRWTAAITIDSASFTVAAIADSGRVSIGDEAAATALSNNFSGNFAVGAFDFIAQKIESIRRLAGKTVTVSFWAVCGSGTLNLGVSIDQFFGTGGSPSATVQGNGQSVTLSTTWTRYSLSFSVPSIQGKTLGTNNNDFTEVNFWYSSGTNNATRAGSIGVQSGVINLWGMQLEIGTPVTPLEKPDPRYDLSNCQRFYSVGQVVAVGQCTASALFAAPYSLPVSMRGLPTMVITDFSSCVNVINVAVQPNTGLAAARDLFAQGTCVATGSVTLDLIFTASADL
jgi:hypothetical protein